MLRQLIDTIILISVQIALERRDDGDPIGKSVTDALKKRWQVFLPLLAFVSSIKSIKVQLAERIKVTEMVVSGVDRVAAENGLNDKEVVGTIKDAILSFIFSAAIAIPES